MNRLPGNIEPLKLTLHRYTRDSILDKIYNLVNCQYITVYLLLQYLQLNVLKIFSEYFNCFRNDLKTIPQKISTRFT